MSNSQPSKKKTQPKGIPVVMPPVKLQFSHWKQHVFSFYTSDHHIYLEIVSPIEIQPISNILDELKFLKFVQTSKNDQKRTDTFEFNAELIPNEIFDVLLFNVPIKSSDVVSNPYYNQILAQYMRNVQLIVQDALDSFRTMSAIQHNQNQGQLCSYPLLFEHHPICKLGLKIKRITPANPEDVSRAREISHNIKINDTFRVIGRFFAHGSEIFLETPLSEVIFAQFSNAIPFHENEWYFVEGTVTDSFYLHVEKGVMGKFAFYKREMGPFHQLYGEIETNILSQSSIFDELLKLLKQELVTSSQSSVNSSTVPLKWLAKNPIMPILICCCPQMLFLDSSTPINFADFVSPMMLFLFRRFWDILPIAHVVNYLAIIWFSALNNVNLPLLLKQVNLNKVLDTASVNVPVWRNIWLVFLNTQIDLCNYFLDACPIQEGQRRFNLMRQFLLKTLVTDIYTQDAHTQWSIFREPHYYPECLIYLITQPDLLAFNVNLLPLLLGLVLKEPPSLNTTGAMSRPLNSPELTVLLFYFGLNNILKYREETLPRWLGSGFLTKIQYLFTSSDLTQYIKWSRENFLGKLVANIIQSLTKTGNKSIDCLIPLHAQQKVIDLRTTIVDKNKRTDELKADLALEMIRQYNKVVLLGPAGCGKTTLSYLILKSRQYTEDLVLALRVDLALLRNRNTEEMRKKFLSLIFNQPGTNPFEILLGFLSGTLFLVCDAANEVAQERRAYAFRLIKEFEEQFPFVPIIVSSRTAQYTSNFLNWPAIEILPLNSDQILSYCTQRLPKVFADVFVHRYSEGKINSKLAQMLMVPFILRLFVDSRLNAVRNVLKFTGSDMELKIFIDALDPSSPILRQLKEVINALSETNLFANFFENLYSTGSSLQFSGILKSQALKKLSFDLVQNTQNETILPESQAIAKLGAVLLHSYIKYAKNSLEDLEMMILKWLSSATDQSIEVRLQKNPLLNDIFTFYEEIIAPGIFYVIGPAAGETGVRHMYGDPERCVRPMHQTIQEILAAYELYDQAKILDLKHQEQFLLEKVRSKSWEETLFLLLTFPPNDNQLLTLLISCILQSSLPFLGRSLALAGDEIRNSDVVPKLYRMLIEILEGSVEVPRVKMEAIITLVSINIPEGWVYLIKLLKEPLNVAHQVDDEVVVEVEDDFNDEDSFGWIPRDLRSQEAYIHIDKDELRHLYRQQLIESVLELRESIGYPSVEVLIEITNIILKVAQIYEGYWSLVYRLIKAIPIQYQQEVCEKVKQILVAEIQKS